ncbi:hypothetical protein [Amycolatopsis sp. cmx-4-54]|uniref:hypothetical protein n=1 Tax=Amycolatopsis sp. cmx-4-54 TaxID=2790936 RepID=UPI00397CD2B4
MGATEVELGFCSNDQPGPQMPALAPQQPPLSPAVVSRSVRQSSTQTIAGIRAMSRAVQTADRQTGGGHLYRFVQNYLSTEIGPLLLDPVGDGAALFTAAASVTEAAGWMAHDDGRDETARDHFDYAYRLATAASNDVMIANVCASMSHLAGQMHQPHDAVRIAEAGLTQVRAASGARRLTARLHAMRARGLATRGDAQTCVRALSDAEHALSTAEDERSAEWIAHFDDGALASEAALCLRRLGDLAGAERHALRVIALRDGDRVRSRAFGQLTLATVLVQTGRLDEAVHLGYSVAKVAPSLASTRVRTRLNSLGAVLRPHAATPDVKEFLDLLDTLGNRRVEVPAWPV